MVWEVGWLGVGLMVGVICLRSGLVYYGLVQIKDFSSF